MFAKRAYEQRATHTAYLAEKFASCPGQCIEDWVYHAEKMLEHEDIVDGLFAIFFGRFRWNYDELVLVSYTINY